MVEVRDGDRLVGVVSLDLQDSKWGKQYKAKISFQAEGGYHIRVVRSEMLDGRVTFIVAANSEAASQLRDEASNSD